MKWEHVTMKILPLQYLGNNSWKQLRKTSCKHTKVGWWATPDVSITGLWFQLPSIKTDKTSPSITLWQLLTYAADAPVSLPILPVWLSKQSFTSLCHRDMIWQYGHMRIISSESGAEIWPSVFIPAFPQVPVITHCRCPGDTSLQTVPLKRFLQVDLNRNSQIQR